MLSGKFQYLNVGVDVGYNTSWNISRMIYEYNCYDVSN